MGTLHHLPLAGPQPPRPAAPGADACAAPGAFLHDPDEWPFVFPLAPLGGAPRAVHLRADDLDREGEAADAARMRRAVRRPSFWAALALILLAAVLL